MSKLYENEDYTFTKIDDLKEICKNATQVNGWYPHTHDGTVRGPFGRWFTCTGGENQNARNVGVPSISNDTHFAASAMNNFPRLLDTVKIQRKEIAKLKRKLKKVS